MTGTNDIDNMDNVTNVLEPLKHINHACKIIVIEIPPRYDMDSKNEIIKETNQKLAEMFKNTTRIKVLGLNVDNLEKKCFIRDGIHMNLQGKEKLAKMIAEEIASHEESMEKNKEENDTIQTKKDEILIIGQKEATFSLEARRIMKRTNHVR